MESRPNATQNQALSALLYLYRNVLIQELVPVDSVRANPSQHMPTVLSHAKVQAILHKMSGIHLLMARLLYGIGMRLMECVRWMGKAVCSWPALVWGFNHWMIIRTVYEDWIRQSLCANTPGICICHLLDSDTTSYPFSPRKTCRSLLFG